MCNKTALRRQLLAIRDGISQEAWQQTSINAQQRLLASDIFISAGSIALYAPVRNEVDTFLLHQAAISSGKQVFYPCVKGAELCFLPVSDISDLKPGSYCIPEPGDKGNGCQLNQADLIVVPGVAFDHGGRRIGFGKGFYDRCLSQLPQKPVLTGLCHDFQLLEQLPAENHDINMHYIVTDKQMIKTAAEN